MSYMKRLLEEEAQDAKEVKIGKLTIKVFWSKTFHRWTIIPDLHWTNAEFQHISLYFDKHYA